MEYETTAALRHTRRRLFVIGPILLVFVSAVATGIAILLLYRTSYQQQKARLEETVRSEVDLVTAIARLNGFDVQKTLKHVGDVQQHYRGIGKTGECMLAVRDGEEIRFLRHHRHDPHPTPASAPFDGPLAEPMRRALQGETDTAVLRDYAGTTVLAAYRPIPDLGWGNVSKINLSEIRAPFVDAAVVVLCAIGVLIGGGTGLSIWLGKPVVAELDRSEERFSMAFRASPIPIVITTLEEGRFVDVNESFLRMVGYDRDELIGRTTLELGLWQQPEERRHFVEVASGNSEAGSYLEVLVATKSGQTRSCEVSVSVMNLGGEACALSIVNDVTERKRAQEEYRAIIHTAMDGFSIVDVNQAYCDLTGYSREELLTMGVADVEVEESEEETAQHIHKIMETGSDRFETRHRCKDGQVAEAAFQGILLAIEQPTSVVTRDVRPAGGASFWASYLSNAAFESSHGPK